MTLADGAKRLLLELLRRLQSGEAYDGSEGDEGVEAGLTPLVHLPAELAHMVERGELESLRRVLPSIAMLREEFEREAYAGHINASPVAALSASPDKAIPYAAGALWAMSELADAVLRQRHASGARERERISRSQLRESVLELANTSAHIRPRDVVAALEESGSPPSPSQVSKVLADLMADGTLETVSPSEAGDRRARYYRLASNPASDVPADVGRMLRRAARAALAHIPGERATAVFTEYLEHERAA